MKKRTAAGEAVKELIEKGTETFRGSGEKILFRLISPAAVFLAAFIAGGTECIAGIYPFGIAILCAARGITATGAAFAGVMLSTLGMREEAFYYIIASFGAFLARVVANGVVGTLFLPGKSKKLSFRESPYIRVGIAAGIASLTGFSGILREVGIYLSIYHAAAGAFLTALFTASFIMLAGKSTNKSVKTAGACAAVFTAVLCLKSIGLPFDAGVIAGFFLTWAFSYSGGVSWGFAVGGACGLAVGDTAGLSMVLLGGVSGMLFEFGDMMAVVSSFFASALLTLTAGGIRAGMEYMPEALFSMAVTVPLLKLHLIPKDFTEKLFSGASFPLFGKIADENSAVRERCMKIGDAMGSLSKLLISVSNRMKCPTPQESYRICTAARVKYCSGCRFEDICTGEEERCVSSFFANMSHGLSVRGKVSARIVPDSLAKRCYNMDAILNGVNISASRLAGLSGAGNKTELLASDYMAISGLLRDTALQSGDWESDTAAAAGLRKELSACGFELSGSSVFGKRRKNVYLYGVDISASRAGEADVRYRAENFLGTKLSQMDFTIEGNNVSASMHTVPSFSVTSGKFSSIGERDTASGDTVTSFENGDGYFYSLVSDGMGSGREAAMTSGMSAEFLKELLSAGCPMKSALELLNCFVRGNDAECFTTVDLMEADLITGRARFIKSGAAPSFVMRDGQLFRLHSKTVPVGIMRALDAEAISFDLKDGDTVIMISDGVTGNYEDCPWLYELLCDGLSREDSPAKMARMIGEAAIRNTGREDDITVAVMKVMKT